MSHNEYERALPRWVVLTLEILVTLLTFMLFFVLCRLLSTYSETICQKKMMILLYISITGALTLNAVYIWADPLLAGKVREGNIAARIVND